VQLTNFARPTGSRLKPRLRLFIQVCHAIQPPIKRAVIHRDIKRAIFGERNDGLPVPKVIDFGIAKATQGRLRIRRFSPRSSIHRDAGFMSPEQGRVDERGSRQPGGDIYRPGVLLYELLTGQTPLSEGTARLGGWTENAPNHSREGSRSSSTRLTRW